MTETPVVTCFLRNRGQVLLLRRSDTVRSFPGQWSGVSGHVAPDPPEKAARREIREETGLEDAVTLVREGTQFTVVDPESQRQWAVHPFLFDCTEREVTPNWETSEWAWVEPAEILRRETVPRLWQSYDHVRPTVERIREDRSHGAAWLSVRALEVLRDEAALAIEHHTGDWDSLHALAATLAETRPSMTVLHNRLASTLDSADERTPQALEAAAVEGIERAVEADSQAAATAASECEGDRILTLSRSGTVFDALDGLAPEAVLLPESRPGGEGVEMGRALASQTNVTLTSDAGLAHAVAGFDPNLALVGADTILADGRVVNKVGTRTLALVAAAADVPVYVVASVDKISPARSVDLEPADPLSGGDLPEDNPLFDATPAALLAGYCTENGSLDTAEITACAEQHRDCRERVGLG